MRDLDGLHLVIRFGEGGISINFPQQHGPSGILCVRIMCICSTRSLRQIAQPEAMDHLWHQRGQRGWWILFELSGCIESSTPKHGENSKLTLLHFLTELGDSGSQYERAAHARQRDHSHLPRKSYWIVGRVPPNSLPRPLAVLDQLASNEPLFEVDEIGWVLTRLGHRWTMSIGWRRPWEGSLMEALS